MSMVVRRERSREKEREREREREPFEAKSPAVFVFVFVFVVVHFFSSIQPPSRQVVPPTNQPASQFSRLFGVVPSGCLENLLQRSDVLLPRSPLLG